MRYSDPRLVEHLASAYVLGTLAPGARRRFERLRTNRADVALAVAQWESRLARLAHSIPPATPSPRVWRAIEARTRPAPQSRVEGRKFVFGAWGLGGLVAGVAAAFLLFMARPGLFLSAEQVALRMGGKLPPSYVGLLVDAQGNGQLLVSSLRRGEVMIVKALAPIEPPPAGQKLVLWALPAEGAPFVLSSSVPLQGSARSRLPGTSEQFLANVNKLAVTLESSDAPATPGPVVYSGNCAKLW